MNSACQLAQFRETSFELGCHPLEVLAQTSPVAGVAHGHVEQQGRRHESLLRAVVQIALDPPTGLVSSFDDPGTRRLQLVSEVRAGVKMTAHANATVTTRGVLHHSRGEILGTALGFSHMAVSSLVRQARGGRTRHRRRTVRAP